MTCPSRADSGFSELRAALGAGSEEAWEWVVRKYGPWVLAVPRELGLSEADSEDVFQATWMALYRRIELLRDARALRKWLLTTARRNAYQLLEQRRRRESTGGDEGADPPAEETPDALLVRLEQRLAVREALAELGPPCQPLLECLYERVPRPSYQEIAEELSMRIGSVGPTRQRCLAKLAEHLEREGFQL